MTCEDTAGDREHEKHVPVTALLVVRGVMLLAAFCVAALVALAMTV